MKTKPTLSLADKVIVTGLIIATIGIIIQIISGAKYPALPPVFFILLIPAGLVAFGRWRWTPLIAVLAGLFLSLGLFSSGASDRLFSPNSLGDTAGLWIQAISVTIATGAGILSIIQNYQKNPPTV